MRSVLWRAQTRRALRPGLAAWGKARNVVGAPQGASWRVDGQRHGARAAQLALAPAKPAPRSTRSAPLTANASHLNVHNRL
ncbi:conserved hypothetical protein [Xanthomonas citri pv. fuscans]|nr:conserved hypothetical protein [Xanthomonas citri pv. fuscans]SOO36258.1 conserved hypothetical protein [Xanthomonas citri pv. fuscans]